MCQSTHCRKSPVCPHQTAQRPCPQWGWVFGLHAGLCSQVPNNVRNVGGLGSECKQGVQPQEGSDLPVNCRASPTPRTPACVFGLLVTQPLSAHKLRVRVRSQQLSRSRKVASLFSRIFSRCRHAAWSADTQDPVLPATPAATAFSEPGPGSVPAKATPGALAPKALRDP